MDARANFWIVFFTVFHILVVGHLVIFTRVIIHGWKASARDYQETEQRYTRNSKKQLHQHVHVLAALVN